MYTFAPHCRAIAGRVKQRNSVLKALAGTPWGQDKETLLITYKAIGRSIINYAAPIWSIQASSTSLNRIQVAQNAALRIATGCHKMSAVEHLHQECNLLPVKDDNQLLSCQFAAGFRDPSYPCHRLTLEPPSTRNMKKHPFKCHRQQPEAADGALGTNAPVKAVQKWLHTDAVERTIRDLGDNRVLGCPPPQVDKSEQSLPRGIRTSLAQLRSGHCRLLNSYMHRLDPNIADLCPACGIGPHDTLHLFNCPADQPHPRPPMGRPCGGCSRAGPG